MNKKNYLLLGMFLEKRFQFEKEPTVTELPRDMDPTIPFRAVEKPTMGNWLEKPTSEPKLDTVQMELVGVGSRQGEAYEKIWVGYSKILNEVYISEA